MNTAADPAAMTDREQMLATQVVELKRWVADLQSGMYVNCVYCGHRYGPGMTTPVAMADALKAHVARCPEHPMSSLATALRSAAIALAGYHDALDQALATLASRDKEFFPSRSAMWPAVVEGKRVADEVAAALKSAEGPGAVTDNLNLRRMADDLADGLHASLKAGELAKIDIVIIRAACEAVAGGLSPARVEELVALTVRRVVEKTA